LPPSVPLVLRVPPTFVRGACSFDQVITRARLSSWAWRFEMSPGEVRFARGLLGRHPELWLYRTDQQALCGDFLLVDMSCPVPSRRRLWAIEVKLGACVRLGGGGASNQLTGIERAVAALRRLGVVDAPPVLVTGDGEAVMDWVSSPRTGRAGAPQPLAARA
jgi:hypothetical protein